MEVDRLAGALRAAGVRRGDAVGVYLPMVPEAAVAAYAVAKVGALYVPVFSGFAAAAIASRLRDSGARVVLAADGGWRRGREAPMLGALHEAVAACPAVERCVVLERLGTGGLRAGRDVTWGEFTAGRPDAREAEDTGAEDPFMIAYTSGTTGRPKGAVHVHGGFLVKIASEAAYQMDLRAGEVLYWVTDMGVDHGPLVDDRRGRPGRDHAHDRGLARSSRSRAGVGHRGPPPRRGGRRVAHADPRPAHPRRRVRAPPRPLLAAGHRVHRRAVEPGALPLAVRGGGGGAAADHQHLRRHRGRRLLPLALPGGAHQAVLGGRGRARDGRGRVRRPPGAR